MTLEARLDHPSPTTESALPPPTDDAVAAVAAPTTIVTATSTSPPTDRPVAEDFAPLLHALLGKDLPVRFECWDGSTVGPDDAPGTLHVRSADALRRIVWSPNELGLGRAYVAGDLDVTGDIYAVLLALRGATPASIARRPKDAIEILRTAQSLGAIGRPLPPPPEEAHPRGLRRHTKERDAQVISHHYDVGNDFYRLVLGPSMTYSCARFAEPDMDLTAAQASKHELICRKLGLHEQRGQRLLDVGCGWGSMAMHAAANHGAQVVGITISTAQAEAARRRVEEAGLTELVEIRLQDYRDIGGETFDAISSVGMSEHVGASRIDEYFGLLRSALRPQGRLLNHAISSVSGSKMRRNSFIYRYVFPDGELLDVGDSVKAMENAGFEVRDVESLREHYALTLRQWVKNLEANWDHAVELAGLARARIWRLYMAGSAVGFEDGGINVHQVLGVVPDPDGGSGMPRNRNGWTTAPA